MSDPSTARPRLDHVVVVVEALEPAIAFFHELGLETEGSASMEGSWLDRINAIDGLQIDIVMLRTPDGHGRLELTSFRSPALVDASPHPAPPNTAGLRSVMFEVDDVDAMVERLGRHGGTLIGEIVAYEDVYRLCYLRGPGGIIVSLAETLGGTDAPETSMTPDEVDGQVYGG
jgi:catechol 2,3-dioxygenase-like lactoylglutathione lyase family enzyme